MYYILQTVCWNDSFRRIFGYKWHESVEVLQFYCGELPFDVMYEGFLPDYPAFQLGFMSCMSWHDIKLKAII